MHRVLCTRKCPQTGESGSAQGGRLLQSRQRAAIPGSCDWLLCRRTVRRIKAPHQTPLLTRVLGLPAARKRKAEAQGHGAHDETQRLQSVHPDGGGEQWVKT